jgi:serine/threonine-protein kinase HipA
LTTVAAVWLWGRQIGAVSLEDGSDIARFQYHPDFARSGIQVSPLVMPLRPEPYAFPSLSLPTFRGLPGLLADSLPDRFGHRVIDAWLEAQGRAPESFNAVERLCYVGARGMGALEFSPALGPRASRSERLQVDALVALASEILTSRGDLAVSNSEPTRSHAVQALLLVGSSAGGARAKAVIAYNPTTHEVRSGQVATDPGFEHWILKFDGVSGSQSRDLTDSQPYCAIEFAYARMAAAAGIRMSECQLLEEGGRRHFITRRFDRQGANGKIHMQSLAALGHYDFNQPDVYSYEQAFAAIRHLGLGQEAVEQQFRRMVFNVLARNQDDHVKNIAFLMHRDGRWELAPAFDLTYSYNPSSPWTRRHQMSVNGKRDGFTREDFRSCGRTVSLPRGRADRILDSVAEAVAEWRRFAALGGLDDELAERIGTTHRLDLTTPRTLPRPVIERAQGAAVPALGERDPRKDGGGGGPSGSAPPHGRRGSRPPLSRRTGPGTR